MPIFWPQTNTTAKEFQIHLLTDFIFAHTRINVIDRSVEFYYKSQCIFKKKSFPQAPVFKY